MRASLGDVSDTGGENTFLARQFFIDVVGNAVGYQAQITRGDGKALAAKVSTLDHIPQAKTHIPAAISQAGDAAGRQRIGALLLPHCHIGARSLIQCDTRSIDATELATALQVSLNDGGDFLRCGALALERCNRNRQLSQANTCHFNPELCQRWKSRCCGQSPQHGSTCSAQPSRFKGWGWKSVNSHWQPSIFPEGPGINTSANVTHTAYFLM